MFLGSDAAMFISCSSSVDISFTCILLLLLTRFSSCESSVPHISNQHQSLAQLSEAIGSAGPSSLDKWTLAADGPASISSSLHRVSTTSLTSSLLSSLPVASLPSPKQSAVRNRARLDDTSPLFSDSEQNLDFDEISGERASFLAGRRETKTFPLRSGPRNERYSSRYKIPLRRYMLNNNSVTCNDGTKAGYYFRSSASSRRWIVFLEGGWYCFSSLTCHQRWLQMRNLMSSAHWPQVRNGEQTRIACDFWPRFPAFSPLVRE